MRVIAPSKEDRGLDSRVTAHPRMAPYLIVVDVDDSGNVVSVMAIPNPYAGDERGHGHEHERSGRGEGHRGHGRGGGAGFFRFLSSLRPDAIVAHTVGPGMFHSAREMGVRIYRPRRTVGESVRALLAGELEEVVEPSE
ncbi:MAG: NifB/NifX family molybdenum-iron cluster-binding protein [Conexivisphaera sp.]